MADSNNARAAELPLTPHPRMQQLHHLVGTWRNEGGAPGTSTFRLGLGGHYLIQEFETTTPRGIDEGRLTGASRRRHAHAH